MTNGELIKILQRFPAEGKVLVRHRTGVGVPIDRAEMQIDAAPQILQEQNVAWADLVKDRIQVVLVYGEPRVAEAPVAEPIASARESAVQR